MIDKIHSYAFGLGTKNSQGEIIEVYYPSPQIHPSKIEVQRLLKISKLEDTGFVELSDKQITHVKSSIEEGMFSDNTGIFERINQKITIVLMVQIADSPPKSIPDAYLKLHLLSHRLAKPNSINLDGLFGILKNLAWTDQGPIDLPDVPLRQLEARANGNLLNIDSVDKFPQMANYIVPS